MKLTFGLKNRHLKVIEKHLKRFDGAQYSRAIWVDIGEEIGWDPLTAYLSYQKRTEVLKQKEVAKNVRHKAFDILLENKHLSVDEIARKIMNIQFEDVKPERKTHK